MEINCINKINKNNEVIFEISTKTKLEEKTLWFSLAKEYENMVSTSLDGALVALILPCMLMNEDMYLDGNISEKLFFNLKKSGPFQVLMQKIIPSLKSIDIFPKKLYSQKDKGSGVITGFSGGIDSFCTLGENFYKDVSPDFKISHLLFNNVGSHGKRETGDELFNSRYKALEPTATEIGLPFIKLNSNMDKFYPRELGFIQTHTLRNAAIALFLQNGVSKFMYASAYSFDDVYVKKTSEIAHCDMLILPMLSTESLDAISSGCEFTRIEKTILVSDIKDSYSSLDICVSGEDAGNCSKCFKCLRTQLSLEMAGVLQRYSSIFNQKIYEENRLKYMAEVLISSNAFSKEILDYAANNNFEFPLKAYSYARVYKVRDFFLKRGIPKRIVWKLVNVIIGK